VLVAAGLLLLSAQHSKHWSGLSCSAWKSGRRRLRSRPGNGGAALVGVVLPGWDHDRHAHATRQHEHAQYGA
jgi:hypothetical protein